MDDNKQAMYEYQYLRGSYGDVQSLVNQMNTEGAMGWRVVSGSLRLSADIPNCIMERMQSVLPEVLDSDSIEGNHSNDTQ